MKFSVQDKGKQETAEKKVRTRPGRRGKRRGTKFSAPEEIKADRIVRSLFFITFAAHFNLF